MAAVAGALVADLDVLGVEGGLEILGQALGDLHGVSWSRRAAKRKRT